MQGSFPVGKNDFCFPLKAVLSGGLLSLKICSQDNFSENSGGEESLCYCGGMLSA